MFLEISGDCNGVCLKNFQRIEQKLENAFLAKVSIFFENFVTLKNYVWNFISSIDASDVSATANIICQHKSFRKLFQNVQTFYFALTIHISQTKYLPSEIGLC